MLIKKFWRLYPQSSNRTEISTRRKKISKKKRTDLQKFNKEYFDGCRDYGYGGYNYDKKFFRKIVSLMFSHYKLKSNAKILDIGCAKGFMMYEFKRLLPDSEVLGIDISKYCQKKALSNIKKNIHVGTCEKLPFASEYFDLVVSISTIHNCNYNGIKESLKEIVRVTKKNSFIRIKAYKTIIEKNFIDNWNLVAKSNLSEKEWFKLFKMTNYKKDYDFTKF
jgi:ubiquinone/menaquinone biosynthesis C-methylase UbiE